MEARAAGDRVEAEAHPRPSTATGAAARRRATRAFYEPARLRLKALFDVEPHGDDAQGKYGVALQAYVKPKGPSAWMVRAVVDAGGGGGGAGPGLARGDGSKHRGAQPYCWVFSDGDPVATDSARAAEAPAPRRRAAAVLHRQVRAGGVLARAQAAAAAALQGVNGLLPPSLCLRSLAADFVQDEDGRWSSSTSRARHATAPPPDASVTRLITMTRRERLSLYDTIHVCACCHFQYVGPRALNVRDPRTRAIGAAVDGIVDAARDRDPAERPDDPPPPAFAVPPALADDDDDDDAAKDAEIAELSGDLGAPRRAAPRADAAGADAAADAAAAERGGDALAAMDDIDAIHSQATATMETAMEHHCRNAASFLDDLDATMATALRDGYGAAPPNDDDADDAFEAPG
ncbi:hypothetical protein JL722_14081 [Aureococcus anophagefferens]|nr:hypothetical protein JL722_14081 [Aureococcus anophagefferens]